MPDIPEPPHLKALVAMPIPGPSAVPVTVRLIVADDHPVVLWGIEALISLHPGLELCASCTDGIEAVEAAELYRPDVLLMDASMGRCGGIEAHQRLRDRGAVIPTIIFAATLDDDSVLECLGAGVDGIVLKESIASSLLEAVHAVARGERWIPPELAIRACEVMGDREVADDHGLTSREMEVVILVAGGRSNKGAAADLGIAEGTLKVHVRRAFMKLGLSNRVQLSLLARTRGWI